MASIWDISILCECGKKVCISDAGNPYDCACGIEWQATIEGMWVRIDKVGTPPPVSEPPAPKEAA